MSSAIELEGSDCCFSGSDGLESSTGLFSLAFLLGLAWPLENKKCKEVSAMIRYKVYIIEHILTQVQS